MAGTTRNGFTPATEMIGTTMCTRARNWKGGKEKIYHISKQAKKTFLVTNNHYRGQAPVNALELKKMLSGKKVKGEGAGRFDRTLPGTIAGHCRANLMEHSAEVLVSTKRLRADLTRFALHTLLLTLANRSGGDALRRGLALFCPARPLSGRDAFTSFSAHGPLDRSFSRS